MINITNITNFSFNHINQFEKIQNFDHKLINKDFNIKSEEVSPSQSIGIISFLGERKARKILESEIKTHFAENGLNNIEEIEPQIKLWLKLKVSKERYKHSLSAQKTAQKIAAYVGYDEAKAGLAALIHDNAKKISDDDLKKIVKKEDLEIYSEEKEKPERLHSPVGAFFAESKLGITDKDVLNAIRFHTIGRKNMTLIEKIVFLADKTEPYFRKDGLDDKVFEVLKKNGDIDKALDCLN